MLRPSAYAVIQDDRGRVACVRTEHGLFLPGGGLEPGAPSYSDLSDLAGSWSQEELEESRQRQDELRAQIERALAWGLDVTHLAPLLTGHCEFEVFIDTILVCSMTAFIILSSGLWTDTLYQGASGDLTAAALGTSVPGAALVVALSSFLFGFSTLIGWCPHHPNPEYP